jgi:radical SAM protein with 4Fe4S-binding SPASM domain
VVTTLTVCAVFGFHGYIAGNIKKTRFRELFTNSNIFVKIRELQPKDFGGVCSKCVFAQYCANACLLMLLTTTGGIMHRSQYAKYSMRTAYSPPLF